MDLSERIKKNLEATFNLGFKVAFSKERKIDKYMISLEGDEKEYFQMQVSIKNDVRFTIICEPSKYGAQFLNAINMSNTDHREMFCKYWESFSIENNEIFVRINENNFTKEQFLTDKTEWRKFCIRFTKSADFSEYDDKDYTYLTYINAICAMQLSLLEYEVIYPEQLKSEGYFEGTAKIIKVNKYERDPRNRMLCLFKKGYNCEVCGFNFFEHYGDIGKDYIEVHHLIPVSKMGPNYKVDPIKDMVPLCSNCHSMIHRKNPPYLVEELCEKIQLRKNYGKTQTIQ